MISYQNVYKRKIPILRVYLQDTLRGYEYKFNLIIWNHILILTLPNPLNKCAIVTKDP